MISTVMFRFYCQSYKRTIFSTNPKSYTVITRITYICIYNKGLRRFEFKNFNHFMNINTVSLYAINPLNFIFD